MTLRVADTGIGIATDDVHLVFEEFEQIEHPLQTRAPGTGLGLPLSRRLAELLGGSLTVASEPGVGSVFSAVLPLTYRGPAAEDSAEPPAAEVTARASRPGRGERRQGPPLRVLIIDDDPVARYMFREYLPRAEFEVSEAADGYEGLRRAANEQPDVVVLDLVMPGMTGRDVLAALRGDPATSGLPVVIASSNVLEPGEERAFRAQNAGLMPKAEWSRETLPDAVRAALGRAL